MKVYQLIYTSVQHSLSDQELGLENQPGMRVWSCSQGITQNNIAEVIKFSTYRLPKNNDVPFSEIIGDPTIPGSFPMIFRTLHLSDGRYALIECKLGSREIEDGAAHLLELKRLIKTHNESEMQNPLREPDLLMIITGGQMAYTRPDGVKIVPIGCLKD